MGVYLEIIFTMLGGLVAGIVGISSTYISLRAHRTEKHLEEHKENLRLLKSALINSKSRFWPFTDGSKNLSLDKEYPVDDILETGINIITNRSVSDPGNGEFYLVDMILYKDIKNHFAALWNKLEKIDRDIKEKGKIVYEDINKISKSVYDKLNKENPYIIELLSNLNGRITGYGDEITVKFRFNDAEDDYQLYIAGVVFLFAIKDEENSWIKGINSLNYKDSYGVYRDIGNAINSEMNPEINEMLESHKKLFRDIDNCVQEIEIIVHQTKLKGRCKLA